MLDIGTYARRSLFVIGFGVLMVGAFAMDSERLAAQESDIAADLVFDNFSRACSAAAWVGNTYREDIDPEERERGTNAMMGQIRIMERPRTDGTPDFAYHESSRRGFFRLGYIPSGQETKKMDETIKGLVAGTEFSYGTDGSDCDKLRHGGIIRIGDRTWGIDTKRSLALLRPAG